MKNKLILLGGLFLLLTSGVQAQDSQPCQVIICKNQDGTPMCAAACPDGYVYRWIALDRQKLN